jgi:hypothetical protein
MKNQIAIIAAILICVFTSEARAARNPVPSPDGKYGIKAGAALVLVDSTGRELLVLVANTSGATRVEVAWAPDSKKVAVVENFARGSAVFAAWLGESGVWHKTLQSDEDQAGIVRMAQQRCGGRLVSENRTFAGWSSDDAIRVKGDMTFSLGKKCAYQYTLGFAPGAVGRLDRGGYEEGIIVGHNYNLL